MRDAAARRRAQLDEPSSAPLEDGREPRTTRTRRRAARSSRARNVLVLGGFLVASIAALYYLLPQLAGLNDTWHRIEDGSPYWMFLSLVFAVGMFGGYVMMFRGVFVRAGRARIGWRESYQITMAGLAASRMFAAGGAGGLVLTAWALRRAGMAKRLVADKTLSFLILTYFPYVAALIVCGLGLRIGLFPGEAPFGLTVVPADSRRSRSRSGSRSRSCRPTSSAASAAGPATAAGSRGSPSSSRTCRRPPPPACATRSSTCAHAIPR